MSSSSFEKTTMIAGLVFQVAIIGLIVWLVYKAYECGTDNSKCSKFVYGLIRTGTKYDKYVDRVPSTQGELINDTKVKSANTCAAWCNKTYGCNGFVWDGTCHALAGDDPKMLTLIPAPGATLYIDQNVDHPGAGFRYIGPAGTDFSSNVSQRLGTVIPNSTITNCAKSCIDQMTSNCIGYSLLTTSNTCQLISNISNTVVTSNIVSYTWGTYSSTDYTEAKF